MFCEFIISKFKGLGNKLVINSALFFSTCQSGLELNLHLFHLVAESHLLQLCEVLLDEILVHLHSLLHVHGNHCGNTNDSKSESNETDDAAKLGNVVKHVNVSRFVVEGD